MRATRVPQHGIVRPVLAVARTFALVGVEALPVRVEVDVARGLPAFTLVGLPDTAVRESRERVRAALTNSGFEFPMRRITVSLAPADVRKAGCAFDLAIAAGVLTATGQLPSAALSGWALAGELGLDGSVRPVSGALAMAQACRVEGIGGLAVACANASEAALADAATIVGLETLTDFVAMGLGERLPESLAPPLVGTEDAQLPNLEAPDLADLRGQPYLRRALEIAAAGAHNLLVTGPPGAGKSLAARRLPGILPPLSRAELLEVARIAGAAGLRTSADRRPARPFRAPHHTISDVGLVGGGNPPRPGEITLAHRGVLFLDELGEFSRASLEALRQPVEDGEVTIVRARHRVHLPCRFILVAAANPCPCGLGDPQAGCSCDPAALRRYRRTLSGALADRIDLVLSIEQPPPGDLLGPPGEPSADVRERVTRARSAQWRRLGEGRANGEMTVREVRRHCHLDAEGERLLVARHVDGILSGRGHDRILRVARTVADLEESKSVGATHVGEALLLRRRVAP